MKRIIYEDVEGVHIVIPAVDDYDAVIERSIPPGVAYNIVDVTTIPSDRTFRNAWVKGVDRVEVDMPKAREIHMGRIRKARGKELDKSDIGVSKEVENGPVSKALKDKRQALRDLPATFDLSIATNPEELKALWPDGLPQ